MKSRWFNILSLLLWISMVFCYPSAPGTCNMDQMGTVGHGPSKSTCDDCYRIIIQPAINTSSSSISDVLINVVGTQSYQGLMLLVKDQANQTVGQFVDFDEAKFGPVACDDEAIEEESAAVIGHLDPYLKSWPIQVGWRVDELNSKSDFRVQGMVVIDYDNFHMIPEQSFTLERKISSSGSSTMLHSATTTTTSLYLTTSTKTINSITASSTTQLETTVADLGTEEWPRNASNPFFLHVIAGLMSIYVIMSILLRFILKSGRQQQSFQGFGGLVGNNEPSESVIHSVKTS